MNRRHEPLDPEERALARLLAEADSAEPSAGVDARILAAARVPAPAVPAGTAPPAIGAGDGARHRRPRRLPLALGLAASVTLAAGVAWQLREPPPVPGGARVAMEAAGDARGPAAPQPEPQASTDTADAAATARETQATARSQASAAERAAARAQEHEAAVAAATRRAAQRGEKAERQAAAPPPRDAAPPSAPPPAPVADVGAFVEAPAPALRGDAPPAQAEEAARTREHAAAVAAAAQRSAQRSEKAARQVAPAAFPAAAPPAPPAAVAMPTPAAAASTVQVDDAAPVELRRMSEPAATDAFAGQGAVLDGDDLARLEADARLPAAQWLQRIRGDRDRGDLALARAGLARFAQAYPAIAVPEDLRPLLP